MKNRDITRWAQKQYAGNVQPWPRWLRLSIIAAVLILIALKVLGVI